MSNLLNELIDGIRSHPRLVVADDFEIVAQHTTSRDQKFHNGKQVNLKVGDVHWVSLRILHRKRPGRSSTDSLSKKSLNQLVEHAFDSAKNSTGDPWFNFPIWKVPDQDKLDFEPIQNEGSLHRSILSLPKIFEENYHSSQSEISLFRKQERFSLEDNVQRFSAKFSLVVSGADSLFWLKEDRASSLPLTEKRVWLNSLLEQGEHLKKALKFSGEKKSTLLFSPQVMADVLKRISSCFYADQARRGFSPVLPEGPPSLFSPVISILDNGRLPGAFSYSLFDMEGTLSRETCVVERGMLKSLLYDAYAARRENRLSTGNYIKFANSPWPGIHATTLYIKPSDDPVENILISVNKGVWVERINSLEPVSGSPNRFVLQGFGRRINRGNPSEYLKEIVLGFDIFDLLKRAIAVGNDLTLFGVCGAPSILFENVPLSV